MPDETRRPVTEAEATIVSEAISKMIGHVARVLMVHGITDDVLGSTAVTLVGMMQLVVRGMPESAIKDLVHVARNLHDSVLEVAGFGRPACQDCEAPAMSSCTRCRRRLCADHFGPHYLEEGRCVLPEPTRAARR